MTPDQSPTPPPRADDHAARIYAAIKAYKDSIVACCRGAARFNHDDIVTHVDAMNEAGEALRAFALSRPAPQPTNDEHAAAVEAWREKAWLLFRHHDGGQDADWTQCIDEGAALMAHRPAAEPFNPGKFIDDIEEGMREAVAQTPAAEPAINLDSARLRRLAEQEDGCPIGVGGLMARETEPAGEGAASDEEFEAAMDRFGEAAFEFGKKQVEGAWLVNDIVAHMRCNGASEALRNLWAKHRRPSGDAAGCAGLAELRARIVAIVQSDPPLTKNGPADCWYRWLLSEIDKLLAARQPAAGGAARDGGA